LKVHVQLEEFHPAKHILKKVHTMKSTGSVQTKDLLKVYKSGERALCIVLVGIDFCCCFAWFTSLIRYMDESFVKISTTFFLECFSRLLCPVPLLTPHAALLSNRAALLKKYNTLVRQIAW